MYKDSNYEKYKWYFLNGIYSVLELIVVVYVLLDNWFEVKNKVKNKVVYKCFLMIK